LEAAGLLAEPSDLLEVLPDFSDLPSDFPFPDFSDFGVSGFASLSPDFSDFSSLPEDSGLLLP
jgi:hypothetical protein